MYRIYLRKKYRHMMGEKLKFSKNIVPDDITINRAQPIMEERGSDPEPVPEKRKTKESKKQVETATANVNKRLKRARKNGQKNMYFRHYLC